VGQTIPDKRRYVIGDWTNKPTRRAVSYTPSSDMTLRHFSFVAARINNPHIHIGSGSLNELNSIEWEIRTDAGSGNKPGTSSSSLLASGSFDWRYSTSWKIGRPIKYTINLPSPLALTGGTRYWFILKTAGDESKARYPLAWFSTYVSGADDEVDDSVYSSYYLSNAWADGDNTYNLTLYILDEQAGSKWHVVIDGNGYMQPDRYKGYRCEQASTGLAQSRGGQSEYSQLRYPYSNLSQDSWTSGAGQLQYEDLNAFLHAENLDTLVPDQMIIGPKVHWTGVETDDPYYDPDTTTARPFPDLEYSSPTAAAKYIAQKFTTPAGGTTVARVAIKLARMPWQRDHTVSVAIYTDDSGKPGSLVGSWADIAKKTYNWGWQFATLSASLSGSTNYWLMVKTSQGTTGLPEYRLTYGPDDYSGGTAKYSTDGADWSNDLTDYSLAFLINFGPAGAMDGVVNGILYGSVNDTDTLAAIAGDKVYTWDETNQHWDNISNGIMGKDTTELEVNATDLIFFENYLIVAQGWNYPIRIWDGTEWGPGPGTDLVTNGECEGGSGWDTGNGGSVSSVDGGQVGKCFKLTNTLDQLGMFYQSITVTEGDWYELTFYHKNGDSQGRAAVGLSAGATDMWYSGAISDTEWTKYHGVFKATSDTIYISFLINEAVTNKYTYFDEIELVHLPTMKKFHIGRGYLYGSESANEVKYTSTLSSWSAAITVGEDMYAITDFVNFAGRLLVGKEDGIWEIDDQDLAREYLLFRSQADPNNCRGWAVWSGMLFIPVQNTVWRWQGAQYKDIGPSGKRAGPTEKWPNKISRMTALAPFLAAAASPVISANKGGLMVYNGMGWHHLASAIRPTQDAHAICVTSEIGTDEIRIWWGEGSHITYVKYPTFTINRYDWENADYNTLGGLYIGSWWDGGLKDALKFWNRLTLIADIPDNTSIEVYCARDGEDWESMTDVAFLGEFRSYNQDDNGEFTVMFPDGMKAKSIQPIFILNTEDDSVTPRIKAYNVESVVRQPPVYVYTFRILLADNVTRMDGSKESSRSANTMWEELQRAAAKDEPIIISFPSKSIRGFISYLREETYQYKPDGMGNEVWERIAVVSVVEAT